MSEWQPIDTAPKDGTRIIIGANFAQDPDIETFDGPYRPVAMGFWQEATPDGADVMGHDAGFIDCEFQWFRPGRSIGNPDHMYRAIQPTHWMPLPPPPTEGQST